MDLAKCKAFIETAKPGERMMYYEGLTPSGSFPPPDFILFARAAKNGQFALTQKKLGIRRKCSVYQYYAERLSEEAIKNAKHLTYLPIEKVFL